jgi:hypothetical protein
MAVGAGVIVLGIVLVGLELNWRARLDRTAFERHIASMHLIGQSTQQVIAKLGPPGLDTSTFPGRDPTEDVYLIYTSLNGQTCAIRFRGNVAIEVQYDDGDR